MAGQGAVFGAAVDNIIATQVLHTTALAQHTTTLANLSATQAQHTTTLANLSATQAQHTQLLTNIGLQIGAMQAQLAHIVNPAGLAATMQAILDARARNAATEDPDSRLAIVLRADGAPPAHWPAAGLSRAALFRGGVAAVDLLLGDYALVPATGASHADRRNLLARHIGTSEREGLQAPRA